MPVLQYDDATLDDRKTAQLLAIFEYCPIVNKTMLDGGMGDADFDAELSALREHGTLTVIPHPVSTGLADRYCLTQDVDLLQPFFTPPDVSQLLQNITHDALYRMKRKLILTLAAYPLLTHSFLAAGAGVSGGFMRTEREQLEEAGIVHVLPKVSGSRRANRYYLVELETWLTPFF